MNELLLKNMSNGDMYDYLGNFSTIEDGEKMLYALIEIYGADFNFHDISENDFFKLADEIL